MERERFFLAFARANHGAEHRLPPRVVVNKDTVADLTLAPNVHLRWPEVGPHGAPGHWEGRVGLQLQYAG